MATGPFVETPFRWLLLFVLALILGSLAEGMYFLVRDGGRTERTRVVKALTTRLLLSLLLFALLITGNLFGLL